MRPYLRRPTVWLLFVAWNHGIFPGAPLIAAGPMVVAKGVHLLMDGYFVERSAGVERKVIPPTRFLAEPIVTGSLEHQNWQPFLTVLYDATASPQKPFRMWYNADVVDDPVDGAYFGKTALLESADGVHWPGPYQRLDSLTEDGRVRFGASVLDDGRDHPLPAERYKMLYFDAGAQVGPRVAFSADGLKWTLHEGGKPILPVNNGDDIWTASYDPIRKRYFLFGKTYGSHSWINAEGKKVTASIRRYFSCFSHDYKSWNEPKLVFSPDEKDTGITQWYGPAGFLVRGDLIIAFLRVLCDDLSPAGAPPEAIEVNTRGQAGLGASGLGTAGGSGMGYTVLAWTRDGETWHRAAIPINSWSQTPASARGTTPCRGSAVLCRSAKKSGCTMLVTAGATSIGTRSTASWDSSK